MDYDIVEIGGFSVKGTSVTTTNAENRFGEMWGEFFKTYRGGEIVAVYSDYESDHNGKFAFTIGVVCDAAESSLRVAGGKFARFTISDRNAVADVWRFVWQGGLDRAYAADFEKYNADGSAEIYISVR